jgi:anti-sigma factor RsiW
VRSSKPFTHLNDDQLLAYLDGEMSIARIRAVRNHLRICWNCRSALAELEAQVEAISRLLLARTKVDADRSDRAKERFLQWRNAFETQRGLFSKFLSLQLFRHELHTCFAQHEAESQLSLLA